MAGIAVSLTADVTSLTAKLAVARADMSATTAELRKMATQMREAGGGATPQLQAGLAQAAEAAASARTRVNALNAEMKATAAPMEAVTQAAEHQAGVFREKLVLAHEALTGNYKRAAGSVLVLAERTGGLGGVLRTLINPTMLATAAIGAMVAIMAKAVIAEERWNESFGSMRAALDATGRSMDFNRQQLAAYVADLRSLPGVSTSAATEMVTAFSRQREVGVASFEKLGEAAAGYARVTGATVPDAAKELVKALNGGYDSLTKLDREFPFLSLEQANAIRDFENNGDKARAFGVAIDALQAKFGPLVRTGLTPTQQELNAIGVAWDNLVQNMGSSGVPARAANDLRARMAQISQELARDQTLLSQATGAAAARISEQIAYLNRQMTDLQATASRLGVTTGTRSESEVSGEIDRGRVAAERLQVLREIQDENNRAGADDAERARIKAEMARDEEALKTATGGEAALIRDNIALLQRQQRELDNRVGAGQLQGLRDELDRELVARQMSAAQQKTFELKFWQDHLSQVQAGSRAEVEIYKQIANLRAEQDTKAANDNRKTLAEEWADFSQAMRDKIGAVRNNVGEQLALADQWVAKGKALYGADVRNYRDALNEKRTLLRQQQNDADRIREIALSSQAEIARIDLGGAPAPKGGKGNIVDQLFGGLTGDQAKAELDRRMEALKLEFQAKQAEFQDIINNPDSSQVQVAEAAAKLRAAVAQYTVDTVNLNRQAADQTKQAWQGALQPITQAFHASIQGIVMGTQTLRQAMANIAQSILSEFVNLGIKLVVNWVATEAAKTSATVAGTAVRGATEAGASAAGLAEHAAASKVGVMQNAYSAAAAVYNDVAQIPYVGWVLAPAAAAGAFTAVAAYSMAIPSAAGGYDIPSGVNPLIQAHEEEVVLPKDLSNAFRAGAAALSGGGAPGGGSMAMSFNIQALDGASVRSLLLNNKGAITQAIGQAARGNDSSLAALLRQHAA